jgi:hypothetical protein
VSTTDPEARIMKMPDGGDRLRAGATLSALWRGPVRAKVRGHRADIPVAHPHGRGKVADLPRPN